MSVSTILLLSYLDKALTKNNIGITFCCKENLIITTYDYLHFVKIIYSVTLLILNTYANIVGKESVYDSDTYYDMYDVSHSSVTLRAHVTNSKESASPASGFNFRSIDLKHTKSL